MVENVRRCGGNSAACWADCEVSPLAGGDSGVSEGKSVVQEERSILVDQIR
jgi:hypothetical protein